MQLVFESIHELIQFWIDSRLNFKNTVNMLMLRMSQGILSTFP